MLTCSLSQSRISWLSDNKTAGLWGPFERGWALFFFPLGGLRVCCDLETISSSSTGAFVGKGFGSSVLQIKRLSFLYLSVHLF